jgi:hypothetical protein
LRAVLMPVTAYLNEFRRDFNMSGI